MRVTAARLPAFHRLIAALGPRAVRQSAVVAFLATFLVAGLVAGLVALEAARAEQRTLERDTSAEVAAIAATLVAEPSLPPPSTQLFAASVGSRGSRLELISPDGRVLFDSSPQSGGRLNQLESPEIARALRDGSGTAVRAMGGVEAFVSAERIGGTDAPRGYIRISRPLAVGQQLGSLARAAVLASFAAGLSALIVIWRSSRLEADRLDRLARTAESLAAGERPPTSGLAEEPAAVTRLARALADIGERLQATTRDMTTERGTLAAILAGMADGVLVVDASGQIVLANPAADRILGANRSGHTVSGRTYIEALRDHDLIQLVREHLLAGRTSLPVRSTPAPADAAGKGTGGTGDDEPVYLEIGLPRRFLRVQMTGLGADRGLIVLQDLTEIRRAETVRREFVANVSHELRTPLASLKALVETLQDGALEDASVARDFLGRMDVEIDGLTQLVRELLDLSRIEAGRLTMRLERIDAATLLDRAAERLRAQADRAGLTLVMSVASDLPPVQADMERLVQALINLIHNAVKFTPPGGMIEVRGQGGRQRSDGSYELLPPNEPGPAPTHVILSIADSGVGIAPEDLSRIFERFYKADKARSGGGTGLGLAIVKHIVEAHGGRIWAESAADAGTTFRIALPAQSRW